MLKFLKRAFRAEKACSLDLGFFGHFWGVFGAVVWVSLWVLFLGFFELIVVLVQFFFLLMTIEESFT